MPSTYKILGQIATTANTLSNVYSVPSATEAVVNSIVVTNTGASNASFSLLVRPDTDSDGDKNYIIRGIIVPGNDSMTLNLSLTLPAKAVIKANSSLSTLSVGAFGVEIV